MNRHHNINRCLLFVVLGGLLFAGSLSAQPPRDGNRLPALPDSARIAQMVDEMATALSLTEEQKSAVSELHFAHFADAKALMEKRQGDRESHRQAMDALRKTFDEQVKALLTDEQKAKYKTFMKNRGPRPGHQRQGQQRQGRH